MTYYVLGFLLLVAVFVVGFFVGGKWKARAMAKASAIKDATAAVKDAIGKG
jgi:hypothetical protein